MPAKQTGCGCMNDRDPLRNLFEQVGELLRLVEENSSKSINTDKIPPDIELKLSKLEKDVQAFKKMGEQVVALCGITEPQMQKRLDGVVEDMPEEAKELIEKAAKLKSKAESLQKNCLTGEVEAPEPVKFVEDPDYGKHRKKKFKRFGSDSKWKPL